MKLSLIKKSLKQRKIKNKSVAAILAATMFIGTLTGCAPKMIDYIVSFDGNGGTLVSGDLNQRVTRPEQIVAPTFEKRGYEFNEWSIPLKTITESTEVKALWKMATYSVTYHLDGGVNNPQNPTHYNITANNILLKDASKNGYTFDYWTDKYGRPISYIYPADASDIEVFAHYTAIGYTISYELNGGNIDSSAPRRYTVTDEVNIPNASRSGYTFLGWSLTESGKNPQTNYKIQKGTTGDIKLYATFVPNQYEITYDVNGGEPLYPNTQTVTYDAPYTLVTPHRNGYSFAGWRYGATNIETSGDCWKFNNNIKLTASWNLSTYSIQYILNGGRNNELNKTSYTYEDSSFNLLDPRRAGYEFLGWTGEGETLPVKNYEVPTHTYGDKVYEAHWEAKKYKVTFDVNGGNPLDNPIFEYTFDEFYNLPVPTRDGYMFCGWILNGSIKISDGKWSIVNDVTLVALWEITEYTITYVLNGGVNHEDNPNGYTCNDTFTLLPAYREGYTFVGWTTDGINEPVNGLVIPENSTGNKVFEAHWIANTYVITYDVNGGNSLENSTEEVTFDSNHSLQTPTREGYSFGGWYCDGTKINNGIWKIASDCTLVARWIANQYTITNHNGSSEGTTTTVTFDSDYNLGTSSKDGYDFQGWYSGEYGTGTQYTDSSGNSLNNFTDITNLDLYAFFTYTVTFESNGGSAVESITYKENECLSESIVSTKKGRTFGGWYLDAELTRIAPHTRSLGTCKLYAKWNEEVEPSLLSYSRNNTGYTINGSTSYSSVFVLPDYIGGICVTEIKNYAFQNLSLITDVVVPDSVTSIGYGAFKGCNSIENMTLPFVGRTATSTGIMGVFGYIFDYTSSSAAGTTYQNGNYFYIPSSIRTVTITNQTALPDYAFQSCSMIEKITIPNSTISIGSYAFDGCSSLIRLNSNVDGVFNIPTSVTSIANYAFHNCSLVEEVTMGDNITSIGNYAFAGCSLITKFNSSQEGHLVVPSSCESIGQYAFQNLSLITDVVVPDSVTSIGYGAFKGCNSIENMTLPFVGRTATSTGIMGVFGYIFDYTSSSAAGTTYQNGNYFYIPSSIRTVTITNQTALPDYAFQNCSMIEHIYLPENCDTTASSVFTNCSAEIHKTIVIAEQIPWDGVTIASSFSSGSGTEEDPYIINNGAQLALLKKLVDEGQDFAGVYFKINKNINMNHHGLIIGDSSHPFGGNLNGNYHAIFNFELTTTNQYVGLFGYVDGNISNLAFSKFIINATPTATHSYVGPIAYLGENGSVSGCYSTGSITGKGTNFTYVGGLVGYSNGTITNCYSSCNVTSQSTSTIAYAGGFVGYVNGGSITECFASGNVTAKGNNDTYSRNGGFTGYVSSSATVSDCYKSSSQVLTRNTTTGSEYCVTGISANKDELLSLINWSEEGWN